MVNLEKILSEMPPIKIKSEVKKALFDVKHHFNIGAQNVKK